MRIGDILLAKGLVTKEKLAAAAFEQSVTKERFGRILVRNGFIRQDDLLKILHEHNPNALHEEAIYQNIIPASVLLDTLSMVTAQVEDTIYVCTLKSQAYVRKKIEPYVRGMRIIFTPANPVRVDEYLDRMSTTDDNAWTWEKMFHEAMRNRASDIHIMPRHSSYTVETRRDGVLHLTHEGTLDEYIAVVSRLKDLAHMDMAERRKPQDGGFSMAYSGRLVNFRVATVPTVDGERMVVRILDPDAVNMSLDNLGISRVAEWRKAVSKSDGLCLICGPTGSGKTTTLAATVREMNFLERAVYTVEDPVENRIPYSGQVNVNQTVGLDFSAAIRTFMRADPDVIVVGEVRDLETARNALKGSETGHLVIATLHTDSIINAIGRLRNIGVQPYELRHLLRGVLVQRLMRMHCLACAGKGCDACNGSGYKGREVISEVASFANEEEVNAVIDGKVSWPLMLEDAREKVRMGKTSEYELSRVLGASLENA